MKFYKRDPDRALAGMAELSLKQRGAYNSLLDLLYSRDGNVPDDDARVAKMMSCHWREWAAVKKELIGLGKVWVEDGVLRARRVQETIKEASDFSQDQSKRASKGWQKRKKSNENNGPVMPTGNALTPTPTPIETPSESPPCSPPTDSDDVPKALAMWNEMASARGLPVAEKLTKARAAKIRARLADAGGLDGWAVALAKIRDGPDWMHGGGERGWLANLDFLLQESSFTKLMEGTYARSPASRPNTRHAGRRTPTEQASPFIARYADAVGAGQSERRGHTGSGDNAGGSGGHGPFGREDETCHGSGDQPVAFHLVGGGAYVR